MKRTTLIASVIALAVMLTCPATADDVKTKIGAAKFDLAVENLLVALKSDNCGLKKSASYMLGELQADKAIIPLMAGLRNAKDDCERIAAAWALCRIGDGRGVYAVKQAARFDNSQKVRSHCAWYYNLYVQSGTFAFTPPVSPTMQLSSR
ncbi:MAG: hypothetical protein FJ217_08435 [Ignavibacteria bacterium]|nr:hypothetical protein [Ignavibacteria bacterium]